MMTSLGEETEADSEMSHSSATTENVVVPESADEAVADSGPTSSGLSTWAGIRSFASWVMWSAIVAAVLIYQALRAIWRGRRSRRWAVAALGAVTVLFVVHIAALAALRDLDIQARRARAGPANAFVEPDRTIAVDSVAVTATDGFGTWHGPNDHVVPVVAALDVGRNVVETADRDGIVLGAPLDDPAPNGPRWLVWWRDIGDAAERWLWVPVGQPVCAAALSLASRFERFDMPAGARGAIRGRFTDSAAMQMVELGSGWAIVDARLYGVRKPFAIALAPPAASVWALCRGAGRCDRRTPSLDQLAAFLSAQSGRRYRLATTDEIAYAAATLRAGSGPTWRGGSGARPATEDYGLSGIDTPHPGDPSKTDVQVAGCSARTAPRVTTVATALANSGTWGKVTELGTPMPANAQGIATIVYDRGHPEERAVDALAVALTRQGYAFGDIRRVANAGAPTPWSLSVVLCPAAVAA